VWQSSNTQLAETGERELGVRPGPQTVEDLPRFEDRRLVAVHQRTGRLQRVAHLAPTLRRGSPVTGQLQSDGLLQLLQVGGTTAGAMDGERQLP
jgi:hypothetical protein